MTIHAVVPVKRLRDSKSRLSTVLTSEQRSRLTSAMLIDIVEVLALSSQLSSVTVLGQDDELRQLLADYDVEVRIDVRPGLNQTLQRYEQQQWRDDSNASIYVMADVPLFQKKHLDTIIQFLQSHQVVIAPSTDYGTNILAKRPPSIIPPLYGNRSAQKHSDFASARNVSFHIIQNSALVLDVDTPKDLALLLQQGKNGRTIELVRSLDLSKKVAPYAIMRKNP